MSAPWNVAIAELRDLGNRFVGWRWEERYGKRTKPPIDVATGKHADSTKPATWGTFDQAQEAVERHHPDGIGFVLTGDGVVMIDLDGCRDAQTGALAAWAQKIIKLVPGYWELSPSGAGVKGFFKADPVPTFAANKVTMGKAANGAKAPAVEVYTSRRYGCLTGQILDDAVDEIVDCTEGLEKLAWWIAKKTKTSAGTRDEAELPQAFVALLAKDVELRQAWEEGTKLGKGTDRTASALDWSLAWHLRPHLDDGDIATVLRLYRFGQIGSGKLKGRDAERRIEKILAELPPRQDKAASPPEWPDPEPLFGEDVAPPDGLGGEAGR